MASGPVTTSTFVIEDSLVEAVIGNESRSLSSHREPRWDDAITLRVSGLWYRPKSITERVGLSFLMLAISLLLIASLPGVASTLGNTSLDSSSPFLWVVAIALCCVTALMTMKSVRSLEVVESELVRYANLEGRGPRRDCLLQPRRVVGDDLVSEGWNRLLDLAVERSGNIDSPRPVANLDREAVTLARAMRGLPVAWIITDADTRIRFISPVACGLLGINDADACKHQNLLDSMQFNDSKESSVAALQQLISPVRLVTIRHDLIAADSVIKLRIMRSRLGGRDGDAAGMAWVLQDITQQQLATEARDQFLMTATHEFRTPLNNLQAYAETIANQPDLDVERQKEFCNVIHSEARRLTRLVDHLLTVGQMEAGSMVVHHHEIELRPVVEYVIDQTRQAAEQKQITLTSHLSPKLPTVFGDRDKLQAAIVNLVGNAVKYTPSGGNVNVACDVQDDWIQVSVKDDGVGIAPEEQPRVFEKFYRGQQALESTEVGNGLGLAFSREVARLHDGDIDLESVVGQGSTFTLRLPIGGQSRSGI